jgi:hypothetical protein
MGMTAQRRHQKRAHAMTLVPIDHEKGRLRNRRVLFQANVASGPNPRLGWVIRINGAERDMPFPVHVR